MNSLNTLPPDEYLRFEDALPWYVNGTLDADEKAWINSLLASSPSLRLRLQEERDLAQVVRARKRTVVAGPDRSQKASSIPDRATETPAKRSVPANTVWQSAWNAFQSWWSRPALGIAAAALLSAQTGVIAWMATRPPEIVGGSHSEVVTEMHTLRVRFKAEASEAQVRNLLVGAGARIIGGPTQLGDYWVASNSRSLDEMVASLQQSGLVASMKVDLSGPRGQ